MPRTDHAATHRPSNALLGPTIKDLREAAFNTTVVGKVAIGDLINAKTRVGLKEREEGRDTREDDLEAAWARADVAAMIRVHIESFCHAKLHQGNKAIDASSVESEFKDCRMLLQDRITEWLRTCDPRNELMRRVNADEVLPIVQRIEQAIDQTIKDKKIPILKAVRIPGS